VSTINKKNLECPYCKYKFVTFMFSGLKGIFCPYCHNKITKIH